MREAILRASGFDVAFATSAESAVSLLRSAPLQFGLIISDHFLTGATGVDVVRQVRSFLPLIPIIIISYYTLLCILAGIPMIQSVRLESKQFQ